MNDVVKLRTASEIEDEAAAWIWRLDGGGASHEELQEFESWLRRDPRHRRAYDELNGVWSALDVLAETKPREEIATFATPVSALEPRQRRFAWAAAAAALVMVIVCAQLWMQRGLEEQTIATAVGQQRAATLADGSVVNLNTNTIIETQFVRDARDVRLLKGEAHFVVMKDPERPFRVRAGNTIVRAVGTRFAVRMLTEEAVAVIVAEGQVEVTAPPAVSTVSGAEPARAKTTVLPVAAGQRLAADGEAVSVVAVDSAALLRTLAWRDGAVMFDGESLAQAVDTLNRYTEKRLVVDPKVAGLRVGGRFRTNDIDGSLSALEAALPVTIRRTNDDFVYIEPRR